MPIAQIIAFLIQAEPEIQALLLSIIQAIKDNHAGVIDAQKAEAAANAALAQLLGRHADPAAQDASDLAAVEAEAEAKFGAKP